MGYMGTDLLTNGEHDTLWRNAFTAVPNIAASLRRSNAIECAKALHDMRKMSDEDYCQVLAQILKSEGFTWH